MNKNLCDLAFWGPSYGIWPGNAFAQFAGYSRWVHLATNTLQFYNVFPKLEGQFPGHINVHGDDQTDMSKLKLPYHFRSLDSRAPK